jgi:opacity protein-like surface antigen
VSTAQAQGRAGLELRGGAGLPTQDFGDATLKTGAGFELNFNYQVMPHLRVYAGWDWHRFVTDEPFLSSKYDVEDTGYAFGLNFKHPLANKLGGWVRGGGILNHAELENDDGDIVADSGHELGWEAGGGFSFALSPKLEITPGVRYRTFSADVEVGQNTIPVDMSYVAIEVGLTWTFGKPAMVAIRH